MHRDVHNEPGTSNYLVGVTTKYQQEATQNHVAHASQWSISGGIFVEGLSKGDCV